MRIFFKSIFIIFKKDMEMVRFVVNCLKIYYPGLINYMLVFQMPFIFNGKYFKFEDINYYFLTNLLKYYLYLSCLEDYKKLGNYEKKIHHFILKQIIINIFLKFYLAATRSGAINKIC